jgi:hypothetical protein
MTREEFLTKRKSIPNEELLALAKSELDKLCANAGASFRMCVPPQVTDTDMVFCELIERFKESLNQIEELKELLYDADAIIDEEFGEPYREKDYLEHYGQFIKKH